MHIISLDMIDKLILFWILQIINHFIMTCHYKDLLSEMRHTNKSFSLDLLFQIALI